MCTVEVCVSIELRMVAGLMSKWRSAIQELLGRTALVARFLCLLHVTNTYLCSPTLAYGPSMFPTLNMTGDVLLVEHMSQRIGKVRPGDVVVVRSPLDPRKILTKRIVGMAGHSVTFMPDPVLGHHSRTVVVPEGHVWIQGDNIYDSIDSRLFGPIPYALIEGKVLFRPLLFELPEDQHPCKVKKMSKVEEASNITTKQLEEAAQFEHLRESASQKLSGLNQEVIERLRSLINNHEKLWTRIWGG